ncbi:hypothetical protein HMPREF1987_01960 [Peptostreptococcaceae bacterium oral taxon 113 str. W5053]|nr:hypothetical protein HMPREF1987_01960 [Peptostreptococcaceae bacterium oral taxon 113 str. W5053]
MQIDIKYIPDECAQFPFSMNRYDQNIAEKRVLKIVKEKSTYETDKYLKNWSEKWDFRYV